MDLERILVIDQGYLFSEAGFLCNKKEAGIKKVPWVDVAALLVEGYTATISLSAIQECASRSIPLVFSDKSFNPCSIVMPANHHILHRELLALQLTGDHRNIWKRILHNKIMNQAQTLIAQRIESLSGDIKLLSRLASLAKGLDEQNIEAQAAKVYWKALFDKGFRRVKKGAEDDINSRLNFGYAILRSYIARYVVLCGLHPGIGIKHRNSRNSFCLIDDLIEPFRPFVDRHVASLAELGEFGCPRSKQEMLSILGASGTYKGKTYPLTSLLRQYVLDTSATLQGKGEIGQVDLGL